MAEDDVLLAERRLLQVQQERLPLGGCGDAGEHGGQKAHAQAAPSHPAPHQLAARLEQVARRGDAIAGRQAPRQLHVGEHDDEEQGERAEADEDLPPEARPEHGAEAHLAEPQPVDVEAEEPARHGEHDDDGDDDDGDDDASSTDAATLGRAGGPLGAHGAHVVHAPSMTCLRRARTGRSPVPRPATVSSSRADSARIMAENRCTMMGSSSLAATSGAGRGSSRCARRRRSDGTRRRRGPHAGCRSRADPPDTPSRPSCSFP